MLKSLNLTLRSVLNLKFYVSTNNIPRQVAVDAMTRDEISDHVTQNYRILDEEGLLVPIPNSVVMRALSAVDPGDFLAAIL